MVKQVPHGCNQEKEDLAVQKESGPDVFHPARNHQALQPSLQHHDYLMWQVKQTPLSELDVRRKVLYESVCGSWQLPHSTVAVDRVVP